MGDADSDLPAYVLGTDRLGRPFTDAESAAFQKTLRAHGFQAARNAALLFGRRLSGSNATAEDLAQRAFLRMVRLGWDPAAVPLKDRLLRLVWSEWTNWRSESRRQRQAEASYANEMRKEGSVGREPAHYARRGESPEDRAVEVQDELDDERHAKERLERLRAHFAARKDNVNLAWLELSLQGKTEPAEMALLSGRKVEEFYRAADRRKRLVMRVVAEDRGVRYDDPEDEEPS